MRVRVYVYVCHCVLCVSARVCGSVCVYVCVSCVCMCGRV